MDGVLYTKHKSFVLSLNHNMTHVTMTLPRRKRHVVTVSPAKAKWHDLTPQVYAKITSFLPIRDWAMCGRVNQAMRRATRMPESQCPHAEIARHQPIDWRWWPRVRHLTCRSRRSHDSNFDALVHLTSAVIDDFVPPERLEQAVKLRKLVLSRNMRSRQWRLKSTWFPHLATLAVTGQLTQDQELSQFICHHPKLTQLRVDIDMAGLSTALGQLPRLERLELTPPNMNRHHMVGSIRDLPLNRMDHLRRLWLPAIPTQELALLQNVPYLSHLVIRLWPQSYNQQLRVLSELGKLDELIVHGDVMREQDQPVDLGITYQMKHLDVLDAQLNHEYLSPLQFVWCLENCLPPSIVRFWSPHLYYLRGHSSILALIDDFVGELLVGYHHGAHVHCSHGNSMEKRWKNGLQVPGVGVIEMSVRPMRAWNKLRIKLSEWERV